MVPHQVRPATLPFPPWNSLSLSSLALSPLIGSRKVAILLLFLVFIVIIKLEQHSFQHSKSAAEAHFLVFKFYTFKFHNACLDFHRVLLILCRLFLLSPTFGCHFAFLRYIINIFLIRVGGHVVVKISIYIY